VEDFRRKHPEKVPFLELTEQITKKAFSRCETFEWQRSRYLVGLYLNLFVVAFSTSTRQSIPMSTNRLIYLKSRLRSSARTASSPILPWFECLSPLVLLIFGGQRWKLSTISYLTISKEVFGFRASLEKNPTSSPDCYQYGVGRAARSRRTR